MKKMLFVFILIVIFFCVGWFANSFFAKNSSIQENVVKKVEKPLERYSFENLPSSQILEGDIQIDDLMKETDSCRSYVFKFKFDPFLEGKSLKITTGQINLPKKGRVKYPVVVMLRGFVNQEIYRTGIGTQNAAEYFCNNGFMTLAPDFLGYAESDKEAQNIFESRFQTYVTVVSLIKSLSQVDDWDGKNIFIWGHSNGGQIALTTLEITQNNIPTTLWAPVSKPFPYSILYYTDESEDGGKLIRRSLSEFEKLYDVEKYSIDNYFDRINAPLQIHQGGSDDAVPKSWSDSLYKKLKDKGKVVEYFTYPSADHNMRPVWEEVVKKDVEFFTKYLKSD